MKYLALAAIAAVPIAACAGYLAHRDPAPPAFAQYATGLHLQRAAADDTDEWLAVAVTGPNKGGAMDVTMALAAFPTHKALEQSAQGKVVYREIRCVNYTTGGKPAGYSTARVVRSCTSQNRTRKQAEKYMTDALTPAPPS